MIIPNVWELAIAAAMAVETIRNLCGRCEERKNGKTPNVNVRQISVIVFDRGKVGRNTCLTEIHCCQPRAYFTPTSPPINHFAVTQ